MNRYLSEKNYVSTGKDGECSVKKNWPCYNKKKTKGLFLFSSQILMLLY
jgi:hypothetical protein